MTYMRRLAFVCLLGLLVASVGPCFTAAIKAGTEPEPSPTPVPKDWVDFTDRNRLFSIRHPQNWAVNKQEAVVLSPYGQGELDFSVLPHAPVLAIIPSPPVSPNVSSASDWLQFWVEALGVNWENVSVSQVQDFSVAGQSAASLLVSGADRRTGIAFTLDLITLKFVDGQGLIVAIAPQTLWDESWPTMRDIVGTLRLLSAKEADTVKSIGGVVQSAWHAMELTSGGNLPPVTEPQSIAVGPHGNLYIFDARQANVQVYSSQGLFLFALNSAGNASAQPQLSGQSMLAVDPTGNVYVVHPTNRAMYKIDAVSRSIRAIGERAVSLPLDVAVSDDGNVYVTDGDTGRVHVLDVDGRAIRQITVPPEENVVAKPQGITVGSGGELYVTFPSVPKVLVLDNEGGVRATIGQTSSEASTLAWPTAIVVDKEGNIFVADTELGKVKQFDAQGQLVATFGQADTGEPIRPIDLAVDQTRNLLYVTDAEGKRILRLPIGEYQPADLEVANGDFEYGLAAWQKFASPVNTAGEARTYQDQPPRGLVLELNRVSEEGDRGEVGVFQPLSLVPRDMPALYLTAQVMVIVEEGENIGGANSELPPEAAVLLGLSYVDKSGQKGEWYRGFYAKNVPNSDAAHFTTVLLETWYMYKSENLLQEIPTLQTITGLRVYGSGQTFTGRVDGLKFVVE